MRKAALVVILFLAGRAPGAFPAAQQSPAAPPFKLQEVMIPVRDGVHLQTVILTPVNATKPLPILFRRTPYGVPEKPPAQVPPNLKELMQDGYIFVVQNLRGRFKSEGVFKLSSQVDLARSQGHQRDDRRLRHASNGSSRTSRTTTARSACTASPTTASPPR